MAINWQKVLGIKQNGSKNLQDAVKYSTLMSTYLPADGTGAPSLSAYSRGVQAISEAVAQVKFESFVMKNGYSTREDNSDLTYLINIAPNSYQNGFDFWRSAMEMVLYTGNCFIKINRDNASGKPLSFDIIRINPRPTASFVEDSNTGVKTLYWSFSSSDDKEDKIADSDLIHLKINGSSDNLLGVDPLTQFERTLRLSTNTEEYANNVYEKNGNMSVVLTTEKALTEPQMDRLSKSWKDRYGGSNGDATVILEEGMDAKPIQITPDQAKFIENRKFQIQEIARILGVPTPVLMDYSDYNYNTAETADLDFYKRSISPKVDLIEKELTKKLITARKARKGKEIKGDVRPLFRADMETRMKYLQDRFSVGSITPNQIRVAEGDEPITEQPAMDKTYIMSNLAPSDKIEGFYEKEEKGDSKTDTNTEESN